MSDLSKAIADLNDQLRNGDCPNGQIMITQGIQALGQLAIDYILSKVAKFNDFNDENDPNHEHDFGSVDYQNEKVFWKIDYYDHKLEFGSQDPSNPEITTRVITIMLASEY